MGNKVILVIDDDEAVREGYTLALEDLPYDIQVAADGEEGLAMAAASRPDLVFLDLKMPGMDGVETLHRLGELHDDLSVYIVTAFANEYMDRLREARDEGLKFQVAAKPLNGEQIQVIAQVNLG